jgi:DNA-binding transcriptional regulator LsrR (DeoR family)
MSTYPDAPVYRNVETSVAAANSLSPKLGRLQRMAEGAIRDAGEHGLTADELAARLNMDRWSIQPRTSELKRKGLIRDSGQRRPNSTGKLAIVWVTP